MTIRSKILLAVAFFITLLISMVVNIPARWLIYQLTNNDVIPEHLSLRDVNGLWWQGNAELNYKSLSSSPFRRVGQISWDMNFLPLLTGKVAADIMVKIDQSTLRASVSASNSEMEVRSLSGSLSLQKLIEFIPQAALLNGAKGDVHFREINTILSLDTFPFWPNEISGQMAVTDLSAFGVEIQQLELEPSLENKRILLQLDGGGSNWKLKGKMRVAQQNSYRTNLQLNSETPESMPKWTEVIMRKTSETHAELIQSGRW